jgi:hypothetical protein
MVKLSYEDFREYCKTNIVKVLGGPELYTAEYITIPRSDNEQIDSVQIQKVGQESGVMHSFRLQEHYDLYLKGMPLGEVMLFIFKEWEKDEGKTWPVNEEMLKSFDKIQSNLILRPLDYSANEKTLTKHIYRRFDNIALVLYMVMSEEKGGRYTAKVSRSIFEDWGISENFIMDFALENTMIKYPPMLIPLELTMQLGFQGDLKFEGVPDASKFFMNPLFQFQLIPSQIHAYYFGITRGISGAIAAFYPKALDNVCRVLNDDVYVVFSSARECMIHPVSSLDSEQVKELPKSAEGQAKLLNDPADNLNAGVYKYTRKNGKLVKL